MESQNALVVGAFGLLQTCERVSVGCGLFVADVREGIDGAGRHDVSTPRVCAKRRIERAPNQAQKQKNPRHN